MLNLANGNLVVQIGMPQSGPFDAAPMLTYNSTSASVPSAFGYGWSESHAAKLTVPNAPDDTTIYITTGSGTVLHYLNKDSNKRYLAPGATRNALVQNADGSWTMTRPGGVQTHFPATGSSSSSTSGGGAVTSLPNWIASSTGQRWSLSYDTHSLLKYVTDPFNRRTTYTYTGAVPFQLRRIQDPAGRITTFTVNAVSGNLSRVITPDLAIVSLAYDGSSRLKAYIDQLGRRTSYGYDSNGWCASTTKPDGTRTSYTYRNWSTTRITTPLNQITTLAHAWDRNIASVTSPLGTRTSYAWSNNRVQSLTDGNGNRTTVAYTTLTNRTLALQTIQDALGGRYSFVYDTSSRVKALIDQLGKRSTLLYDASNNRIAVIDAQGQRFTSLYNNQGQVTASINQLGKRWTTVYDTVGQAIGKINPVVSRSTYAYNTAGQVVRSQDPRSYITCPTYGKSCLFFSLNE
jgi:YD repeat-containing protein